MKDGGPAFPYSALAPDGPQMYTDSMGMSLRDYFAAKAMQAIVPQYETSMVDCIEHMDFIAAGAFKLADAMLKAREVEHEST